MRGLFSRIKPWHILIIVVVLVVGAVAVVITRNEQPTGQDEATDLSGVIDKKNDSPVMIDEQSPQLSIALVQSKEEQATFLKTEGLEQLEVPEIDYTTKTLIIATYQASTPGYSAVLEWGSEPTLTVTSPPRGCVYPQVITSIAAYAVADKATDAPQVSVRLVDNPASCPN